MKSSRFFGKNVIYAQYERADPKVKIFKEIYIPPDTLFVPLGYDEDCSGDKPKRHYRRYYPSALEKCEDVMEKTPFNVYPIKRGQSRGVSGGLFSKKTRTDDTGMPTDEREVGIFKGIVSVDDLAVKAKHEEWIAGRMKILKQSLSKLHEAREGSELSFDYDKLQTAEGRTQFQNILDNIGVGDEGIMSFLSRYDY